MKRRILLQTNPTHIKTGLASNSRALLKHLYKTNKYDLFHYCSQVSIGDPALSLTPWKSIGCLPTDPRAVQELNADPGKARDASYGSWNIDAAIKEVKPDVFLGVDDPWAFGKGNYMDKPWWNKINSMLHITLDSLPILEQALEQAKLTKNYFTWVKFAADEMKRLGADYNNVRHIYASLDINQFTPISESERTDLRKRFGISPNTVIFNFVFRNQLRKSGNLILEAFAQLKKDHPTADVKLHFHTSWSEKGNGWDFPKMMAHYGVNQDDVLCTYVCKVCGQWHINPYKGENLDCPYCGAKQSLITSTIVNGVPEDEMKYMYGVADAGLSIFTSGGFEMASAQTLLCGQPLACTNYFCGADFCDQDFVHSVSYHPYHEAGTNFIKAASDVRDIKRFMSKVWKTSRRDLQEWGAKGREWAAKTFSIDSIGCQWEAVFDATTPVDWSSINLVPTPKNDTFPMPTGGTDDEFVTALYRNILKMDEPTHGEGHKSWIAGLQQGRTRQQVYDFFVGVARQDNAKIAPATVAFDALLDKTTGRTRTLLVLKESIGDILIITSLFRSLHDQHPNTDLYVAVDAKYADLILGNPHVFKVLAYDPIMEQEMAMLSVGQSEHLFDYYYYPALQTQRQLAYLGSPTPAFDLTHPAARPSGLDNLGKPPFIFHA